MQAREPQGPIQNNFGGLLSFLGIKGQGIAPNSFQGFVQGVTDVTPFMLSRTTERLFGQAVLAANTSNYCQVISANSPAEGECWYVRNVTCRVEVLAASQLFYLGLTRAVLPVASGQAGKEEISTWSFAGPLPARTVTVEVAAVCDKPFILLNGQLLGANIQGFVHAGSNATVSYNAEFYRLKL